MTSREPEPTRAELLLRTSRWALMIVLSLVLLIAATLIAHAVRPGTLLADWAGRAPWLLPVGMVIVFTGLNLPLGRRLRADDPEVRIMLQDEFRQMNLARAQRLALIVVLVAQVPLGIVLSGLTSSAALTVMAISTITLAMATLITAFLIFDRG